MNLDFTTEEEYQKIFKKHTNKFIEATKKIHDLENSRKGIIGELKRIQSEYKAGSSKAEDYEEDFEKNNAKFIEITTTLNDMEKERQETIKILRTIYNKHKEKFGNDDDTKPKMKTRTSKKKNNGNKSDKLSPTNKEECVKMIKEYNFLFLSKAEQINRLEDEKVKISEIIQTLHDKYTEITGTEYEDHSISATI